MTLPLILVLLLAAALRVWGLRWGLPNALHSYSYHPDEFLTVGAAGIILTSLFPRFYNYPSLYLYLAAFAMLATSAYGLAGNMAAVYLAARVVTALLGTLAVAATYWAASSGTDPHFHDCPGRANSGGPGHVVLDAGSPRHVAANANGASLMAALILCIAPLHVQHSHFATVDVPSTLFVALCLGFAFRVLSRGAWRDYLLCGATAGFAAGTKYNAGLIIFSLAAAHFLSLWGKHPESDERLRSREHPELVHRRSRSLLCLLSGLACAVLAFIVSTPGSIFQTRDFLYGLTYEMRHAGEGHGLVFAGTGNGFLFTFTSSLWYGLGPALSILFVIAAIYGLVRLDKRALIIVAFALPYYALVSLSQVRFARYSLPLFPPAALLIVWMTMDLWRRFPKALRWALGSLLAVALAGTLLYTIALDRLFVQTPPQDRAARWIFANIPKGSPIGMVDVPWFYSPPYSKAAGMGTLQQRQKAVAQMPYQSTSIVPPNQAFIWTPPRWAVTSDYETGDAQRLQHVEGLSGHVRYTVRSILSSRAVLDQDYILRAQFCSKLALGSIAFGDSRSLPHDMKYPAPTISIYERRK